MSAEENKAMLRRLYDETFPQWNLAVIDELFGPTSVGHELSPGTVVSGFSLSSEVPGLLWYALGSDSSLSGSSRWRVRTAPSRPRWSWRNVPSLTIASFAVPPVAGSSMNARARPYPTHYTAPINRSVSPLEHITVTDPTHPLYALTLPCVGITTNPQLGPSCIVSLAPGVERLIPLRATSLAPTSQPPSPCRLSVAALHAVLAVLGSLLTTDSPASGQEDTYGATQSTSGLTGTPPPRAEHALHERAPPSDGARACSLPTLDKPLAPAAPALPPEPWSDPHGGPS